MKKPHFAEASSGKRVYSGIRAKKKVEPFYFDDCFICEATKLADREGRNLGEQELKDIFKEANRRKNLLRRPKV